MDKRQIEKYTANYAQTNHNFVIQNLDTSREKNEELLPILYVLKNILQRGCPTMMSKYLQEKLGKIQNDVDFNQPFLFISKPPTIWYETIKGDQINNTFPL